MSVTTRAARDADVDFLTYLFLNSMRESITAARGFWDPVKEDVQFRKQLEIEHTRVILSENIDVGFVTARREDARILIGTLCVSSKHQGSGIGTQIIRELMLDAASAKVDVELFVLKANSRARGLYARLGFVEDEETPSHVRMLWHEAG